MHFHHHGYVSGDPREYPEASGLRPQFLPPVMDVLVVGAGPAGIITAAQLSMFPDVHTRIIDRRGHRLMVGQADGIQARSVETFQAFGFASPITDEAYRITEMCFWKPDPENPERIIRTARTVDDPENISEFPHLIVNQARVIEYFADFMRKSPTRLTPDYGWEFIAQEIDETEEYPIKVTLRRSDDGDGPGETMGVTRTVRCKFLVGADGAHSPVRKSIGRCLEGDQANHAWGVMDVLANSDFPDMRTKCSIQSKSEGNILLIPREGGHLVRWYVDLGTVTEERKATVRSTTIDEIIAKANAIISPYSLDVKDVSWHSVYEVGHRLTDKFDDVAEQEQGSRTPRVFIMGDACHTHSAKAGQGMNVSMQDGFNLGWKLGHVIRGTSPAELLDTYSDERQVVAGDLIRFDKEWSTLMATPPEEFEAPSFLEDFYVKTAEFPAGFMTEYTKSLITDDTDHQDLAPGFPIGKRFRSRKVVRICDANPIHLGHTHVADGRWRIYVFADSPAPDKDSKVRSLARWLQTGEDSPVRKYTPEGGDDNALFDIKVIYQQPHDSFNLTDAPDLFFPEVGPFKLQYTETVFGVHPEVDIFDVCDINRDGCMILVRPDQYVSAIFPLDAHEEIRDFMDPIFTS
ncbi:FAD-dependent monooxygenase [Corynebacterium mendelii]|uniref:FAD-dependent monooxygenase n=1 Tax=Corynebacterium mendelii TaxID=2765362 RepID=A0A939DZY9_9CORY|nr:FAD-dependent monooxygenase [Corynebacterium mendelii]MBN9643216.1 FAD-dependent monooxygenase [Corynebacterium mendelii]